MGRVYRCLIATSKLACRLAASEMEGKVTCALVTWTLHDSRRMATNRDVSGDTVARRMTADTDSGVMRFTFGCEITNIFWL